MTTLKIHFQLLDLNFNKVYNLQKDKSTPENKIHTSLSACSRGIDRINKLFDEISLLNRPEQKAELEFLNSKDFSKILNDIESIHGKNLTIQTSPELSVFAEKIRLKVILSNLVSNGIRYGKKVSLDIYKKQGYIIVDVKDNGPGISYLDKDKIFLQFYRAEKAQSLSSDGLGLGLYICQKLTREISASLILKNPGEKKAHFEFKLISGETKAYEKNISNRR